MLYLFSKCFFFPSLSHAINLYCLFFIQSQYFLFHFIVVVVCSPFQWSSCFSHNFLHCYAVFHSCIIIFFTSLIGTHERHSFNIYLYLFIFFIFCNIYPPCFYLLFVFTYANDVWYFVAVTDYDRLTAYRYIQIFISPSVC